MRMRTRMITKEKTSIYLLYILLTIICNCCEIETYDNGKLDGYWKLYKITNINNGKEDDLINSSIFWAVQAKFIVLQNNNQNDDKILYRFNFSDDSLSLYSPMIYDKLNGNYELKNVEILKQFGIYNLRESFHIEKLTNKDLILSSESLYLYFRKF